MNSQPAISTSWSTVESTQSIPPLKANELQVWHIDLAHANALLGPCYSLLTAQERTRADGRRQPQARQHIILGRGCLRILLGAALGIDPAIVPIVADANKKPQLAAREPGLREHAFGKLAFNVAHSAGTILIALAATQSIGIDAERIDSSMDYLPVAQNSFTPSELAELLSIDDPTQQRSAFYRCWTHKEAVAKADGRGLLLPLTSFRVPVGPTTNVAISLPESTTTFYLSTLALVDDIAAAIAVDSPNLETTLLRFPPAISRLKA